MLNQRGYTIDGDGVTRVDGAGLGMTVVESARTAGLRTRVGDLQTGSDAARSKGVGSEEGSPGSIAITGHGKGGRRGSTRSHKQLGVAGVRVTRDPLENSTSLGRATPESGHGICAKQKTAVTTRVNGMNQWG